MKSPIIIIGGIILGCIFGVLITSILIKKLESKKSKKTDFNSNDEFRTGSIRVVFNNNNSNNPNGGIINNNNNNVINNNNNKNNIHSNLNPNIMINSNNYNSNNLSGRVVFINNPPQNSVNVVMNSVPLYNNNNQNNDHESLNMQKSLSFHDNESNGYITSVTEGDEPPPEYTEADITKSMAKRQFM